MAPLLFQGPGSPFTLANRQDVTRVGKDNSVFQLRANARLLAFVKYFRKGKQQDYRVSGGFP
jgi:hypothetical protein